MPFQRGSRTSSKDSIPYGEAASARALTVRAVMVFTFWFSSVRPCLMMSTIDWTHTRHFQLLAEKPKPANTTLAGKLTAQVAAAVRKAIGLQEQR